MLGTETFLRYIRNPISLKSDYSNHKICPKSDIRYIRIRYIRDLLRFGIYRIQFLVQMVTFHWNITTYIKFWTYRMEKRAIRYIRGLLYICASIRVLLFGRTLTAPPLSGSLPSARWRPCKLWSGEFFLTSGKIASWWNLYSKKNLKIWHLEVNPMRQIKFIGKMEKFLDHVISFSTETCK